MEEAVPSGQSLSGQFIPKDTSSAITGSKILLWDVVPPLPSV